MSKTNTTLTIVRNRDWENQQWVDVIVIEHDGKDHPETILRNRIKDFLSTPRGWLENCRAYQDFNWGDLSTILPLPEYGINNASHITNYEVISVDQDEKLSDFTRPGTLRLYGDKENCFSGEVNMRDGKIQLDSDNDYKHFYECFDQNKITSAAFITAFGVFNVNPNKDCLRLAAP